MEENVKSFLLSKTMWGIAISFVGLVLTQLGFDTTMLNGLDGEIVSFLGLALAGYGRIVAVKKLK